MQTPRSVASSSPALKLGEASPASSRSGVLRPLRLYLLQLASLAYFFAGGALVSLLAPFLRKRNRDASHLAGQELLHRLFSGYVRWLEWAGLIRFRFHETERLSTLSGAIVAANHPGLLDAVILLSKMPRATCIMRSGLQAHPTMAGGARLGGYIRNDCGKALIVDALARLEAGENLLIFPEGTRTRDGALGGFKKGFALMALRSGAPIHPVLIEKSGSYLGKGSALFLPTPLPIEIAVRVEDPILPEPGESASALAERVESFFRQRLVRTAHGIECRATGLGKR